MAGRAAEVVLLGGQGLAGMRLMRALVLWSPTLVLVGVAVGAGVEVATRRDQLEVRPRLRRVGVDEADRAVLRPLVVLVVGLPLSPRAVGAGYAVGVAALVVASRSWLWAQGKVAASNPIVAAESLPHDLSRDHLGAPSRCRTGATLVAAVEVPLALGIAVAAAGSVAAGGSVLEATVLGLVAVSGWVVCWALRFSSGAATERHVEGLRAALEAHEAKVQLCFSGGRDTTYQANQWVPVLDRLDVPVTIVVRERHHLDALAPTQWPVLFCCTTHDVEDALTDDTRVALYVSNAGRDLHLLRYGHLTHVFLNHGGSDKASSFNSVVKVYDKILVAGELGIERYRNAGVDLPDGAFEIVGRHHFDRVTPKSIPVDPRGSPTVLYAPTREGLLDEVNYSSVEVMGLDIVETILRALPEVRTVFKPHPMTGTVRPSAGRAVARITPRLREAGQIIAADEPDTDLLGWFERADVLVTDISAVAADWLAPSRPYLVTDPGRREESEFREMYPSHAGAPVLRGADDVASELEEALTSDPWGDLRVRAATAVLGHHAQGPQRAFGHVLACVVATEVSS